MGFNLNKAKAAKEEILRSFTPLELNAGNVQAIFNRCLVKATSEETAPAVLFPVITGYSAVNNEVPHFDKNAILSIKRTIEYLFGQLHEVHSQNRKERLVIKDFMIAYTGRTWTENRDHLLALLYLGVTPGITLMTPFNCKLNNTTSIKLGIKPTLSPKDPNFPAWWEAHKGEWED